MKCLFLLLAILLAMEPVVPVADCWMNGQCWLVCRNDEESVTRCSNSNQCHVLSHYLTIQPVTTDRILNWTTPQPTRRVKCLYQTLRCMGNVGICRTSCKKAEHPYFYCRNDQSCCLRSYMKINISGREDSNN